MVIVMDVAHIGSTGNVYGYSTCKSKAFDGISPSMPIEGLETVPDLPMPDYSSQVRLTLVRSYDTVDTVALTRKLTSMLLSGGTEGLRELVNHISIEQYYKNVDIIILYIQALAKLADKREELKVQQIVRDIKSDSIAFDSQQKSLAYTYLGDYYYKLFLSTPYDDSPILKNNMANSSEDMYKQAISANDDNYKAWISLATLQLERFKIVLAAGICDAGVIREVNRFIYDINKALLKVDMGFKKSPEGYLVQTLLTDFASLKSEYSTWKNQNCTPQKL